jgi:hypothetical protein
MFLLCSYRFTLFVGRSDVAFEPRRSIFDIVYQTNPERQPTAAVPLVPRNRPVNFLYMGLFLRFKKS